MQDQLPGFIKTAEALQIKGLAAVNNNNNNNNYFNHNIKLEQTKYNSSTPIQDITKFNAYGPNHPHNMKYELNNSSSPPPLSLTPTDYKSPPLPFYKKRRYGSPSPQETTLLDSTQTSIDNIKASPTLPLNTLAPSMTSVASMASISVAKAISLSKLVHEISSQASIASLKSASLPPSHPLGGLPDDITARDDVDQHEPNTPPPQQPLPQMPTAQFHNTSER